MKNDKICHLWAEPAHWYGTGTESGYEYPLDRGKWYRYQKLMVPIPIHRKGLVPVPIKVVSVPIKVVPVPELPTTLFLYPCIVKP